MIKTSSPPRIDSGAGGAPQWSHRRDYRPTVDTTKGFTPSGPIVVHRSVMQGTDLDTGQPVDRVTLTLSNGATVVSDYDADGEPMSTSPRFTPARATTERKVNAMFDTDLDTGQITEFARVTSLTTETTGEMTYGPALDKTPDLVADYVVAGHADEVPALVRIATRNDDVVGSTPYQIDVPDHAAYGEVYIEAENIRWTQDGSTPAVGNGEQERAGTTIHLYGTTALTGFRALCINNVGALDPSLTAKLTVTLWNAHPERGPYSMTAAAGASEGPVVLDPPSVSALIMSYVEGNTSNVDVSASTFTFTLNSPLIEGVTALQNAEIAGFSGGPGGVYGLPQVHTLDLSVLGVSAMSDPVSFTTENTWVLHLVGNDTGGAFHRMETNILPQTVVDFPSVSAFYFWLMDQFVVLYSDTGLSSPSSLLGVSFEDGILTLDATASGLEWDNTGGFNANERQLSFTRTTYVPATVTNAGYPVAGTWVDVSGDQMTWRFDIADPLNFDFAEPLVFNFEGAAVDPAVTKANDGSLIATIDIAPA